MLDKPDNKDFDYTVSGVLQAPSDKFNPAASSARLWPSLSFVSPVGEMGIQEAALMDFEDGAGAQAVATVKNCIVVHLQPLPPQ